MCDSLDKLLAVFPTEKSCIEYLEFVRWPYGIICPNCGMAANHHRRHLYFCKNCRKEFSVRKGTIFEGSRLHLRKWFIAIWFFSNCRNIRSTQLARQIQTTQKTAWLILNRLKKYNGENHDAKCCDTSI